jgi:hypothetical protein
MNLAPLRYARVLLKQNGPVERIETARMQLGTRELILCNAYLSRHLNVERPPRCVFGDADGTGTHATAIVARHKAISEAIERWALYYLHRSGNGDPYGLKTDPTTAGMAAYPGLFAIQSRKRALAEATERFCLTGWWEGTLRSRVLTAMEGPLSGIEIENPIGRHRIVVVWKRCRSGFYAYGFAGNASLKVALRQAEIEMERAAIAISLHHTRNPGFELDDLDTIANTMERRAIYFSLHEGHREFSSRVESSAKGWAGPIPGPVVDRELRGPWSRYASVWRVLYPTATNRHLRDFTNVFYW